MDHSDALIRPELKHIAPCNSELTLDGVRKTCGVPTIAKLRSNENPLGASPWLPGALAAIGEMSRLYPDPQGRALCDRLAALHGVAADQITVGNGSEDLIAVICRAGVRLGDTVATLCPSFPLREDDTVLMGGRVKRIPVADDLAFDQPALLAAAADAYVREPYEPGRNLADV